jgi:hypothetical protein
VAQRVSVAVDGQGRMLLRLVVRPPAGMVKHLAGSGVAPPMASFVALVDTGSTGASGVLVALDTLRRFKLKPSGSELSSTANGPVHMPVYHVDVELFALTGGPAIITRANQPVRALTATIDQFQATVGWGLLQHLRHTVDGPGKQFTLA